MRKHLPRILGLLCVFAAALAVLPIFLLDTPWPSALRDLYQAHSQNDTGALNVVSAIYLGYRAFDTLGETVVLLIAVAGTLSILSSLAKPSLHPASSKTLDPQSPDPLELVAGKLGLVVLVFGSYVMAFGHLSPGGGFQGGVVVASGLLFLGLGERGRSSSLLTDPYFLARLEALTFSALLGAMALGIFQGAGFLGIPGFRIFSGNAGYIICLNILLGLKVGAGIGLVCVAMIGDLHR